MKRFVLLLMVLSFATVAFGAEPQGEPGNGAPDGGVKRRKKVRDGGVSPEAAAGSKIILIRERGSAPDGSIAAEVRDAGPAYSSDDVARLEKEVAELRARTATLEKQVSDSKSQQSQLSEISQQLQSIRTELSDAESRRVESDRQASQHRQQMSGAVNGLIGALQQLQTGNTNIDDALSQAGAVMTGQAKRDLDAARSALANHDLNAARTYLTSAIFNAQSSQY